MKLLHVLICVAVIALAEVQGQSGRTSGYSESGTARISGRSTNSKALPDKSADLTDPEIVRVNTDLVTIPVRILSENGKPIANLRRNEFKIFENGLDQQIAYFSDDEQPFTVVLILDMSYSSVFKLEDIQLAARIFVSKLREHDRVMVVSFDEKARVLCEATNDRRVLRLAIDGARIGSGTALYDTLDMVGRTKLEVGPGRRAIVLLSDGVDTASVSSNAKSVETFFGEEDVLVYPIYYDTYSDVQKSRRKDAEIRYDEDDRPYVVKAPPKKGEREQDYKTAKSFLDRVSTETGGRVYIVSSTTNLNDAFANIAEELRKIYSIGYYPSEDRQPGGVYDIKVRVYRPNLKITTRNQLRDR